MNGCIAKMTYMKKYIPQSAVDALLRFDFPALKAEFAKYHNNANKSWNLICALLLTGTTGDFISQPNNH